MSLSQRDYLMRMIEQLAETIASILGRAGAGQTNEALAMIENARLELFGPLRRSLESLDPTSVASLLGDVDRVRAYAMLLACEGEVRDQRGEIKLASSARKRALETYLEIATRRASELTRDDRARIRALADRVDASRFPAPQRDALAALTSAAE